MRSPDLQSQTVIDGATAALRRRRLFRGAMEVLRLIVGERFAGRRCRPAVLVYGGHIVTRIVGRWLASFPGEPAPTDDELRLVFDDLRRIDAIASKPPHDGMFIVHRCDRN